MALRIIPKEKKAQEKADHLLRVGEMTVGHNVTSNVGAVCPPFDFLFRDHAAVSGSSSRSCRFTLFEHPNRNPNPSSIVTS
jgi:hypothetical protein